MWPAVRPDGDDYAKCCNEQNFCRTVAIVGDKTQIPFDKIQRCSAFIRYPVQHRATNRDERT